MSLRGGGLLLSPNVVPHHTVSKTATALVRKYYRSIFSVGNKISQSHFVEADESGESLLRTTAMSTPSKQPVNALDRPTQDSATRSIVQSAATFASQTHRVSAEVPIGVLEVPVGVWGSRASYPVRASRDRLIYLQRKRAPSSSFRTAR